MSTNEDQLVSQGQDAEILLKNENFNKVVKALLDQYVQVFFNTDPAQTDERSIGFICS